MRRITKTKTNCACMLLLYSTGNFSHFHRLNEIEFILSGYIINSLFNIILNTTHINSYSLMGVRATEPKSGPEVIAAGEERWMRRRMNDVPDWTVVSQRHEMQSRRIPRIPRTQRGGRFVREEHVVLGVVKHSLGAVLLFARRSSSRVRNQATTRAQFPQLHHRVLARRQKVLPVLRKDNGAHFCSLMSSFEGVDAPTADTVPQLNRTVVAASRKQLRS